MPERMDVVDERFGLKPRWKKGDDYAILHSEEWGDGYMSEESLCTREILDHPLYEGQSSWKTEYDWLDYVMIAVEAFKWNIAPGFVHPKNTINGYGILDYLHYSAAENLDIGGVSNCLRKDGSLSLEPPNMVHEVFEDGCHYMATFACEREVEDLLKFVAQSPFLSRSELHTSNETFFRSLLHCPKDHSSKLFLDIETEFFTESNPICDHIGCSCQLTPEILQYADIVRDYESKLKDKIQAFSAAYLDEDERLGEEAEATGEMWGVALDFDRYEKHSVGSFHTGWWIWDPGHISPLFSPNELANLHTMWYHS